jgi:DNA invertase Pin-like site-specific DNA recombinase
MRCAIYVRVSLAEGQVSAENQLIQLRAYAKTEKWVIAKTYRDDIPTEGDGHSAYGQMRKDAENRKFDVLLFWSLDRFSRLGVLPTLRTLTQFTEWGIRYKSFTEAYIDTTGAIRETVINILSAISRKESGTISERTKIGLAIQREIGTTGPGGYTGPGKPHAEFDRKLATKLRREKRSLSFIAKACGVSKPTIFRFLRETSKTKAATKAAKKTKA